MTLVWLPPYYVPLFFVPYLFRLEGGWPRRPREDLVQIPRAWAAWLEARGFLYAALAAAGFAFAGALARAWPWAIDPVEVRMRRAELTRRWGTIVGAALLVLFAAGLAHAVAEGFPPAHSLFGIIALDPAGHVFHFATSAVARIFGRAAQEGDA